MTFASLKQIVTITLLWTATLYGVDYTMRPRPLGEIMSPPAVSVENAGKPQVSLLLNRVCCTNCVDGLKATVAKFPWAGAMRFDSDRLDIDVSRVNAVDFVPLANAVHDAGFAIDRIEVSGLSHYRLEATLPRMCTFDASEQARLTVALRSEEGAHWIDSLVISKPQSRLTVYARYGDTANVTWLSDSLESFGYVPSMIRLSAEPERATP